MKLEKCLCGKEPHYIVHPNYRAIGAHAVACICGIVLIGSTDKNGKNEVIKQWNNTFKKDRK